jgi:SAM-dependent methyltransferase
LSYYTDILAALGRGLPRGARVLDLGCGEGELVAELRREGWDAHGCDLTAASALSPGSREHGWDAPGLEGAVGTTGTARELAARGLLLPIATDPYRLPYEDGAFDAVFTNQVLEHVTNLDETLAEVRRVLRPGGVSLHSFPARYRPVEVHVLVPLAGFVRHPAWLRLWAALGVRNRFQRGLDAAETARRNHEFLTSSTSYPKPRELRSAFSRHFGHVRWVEEAALGVSPNAKGRLLHRLGRRVPGVFPLFRLARENVVLAADPRPRPGPA